MDHSFQTLTAAVLGAEDFAEMAGHMLEAVQRLAAVEAAYITRVDADSGTQRILGTRHWGGILHQEGDTLDWRDSLCAYALASGEIVIPDAATRWPDAAGSQAHGARRYICYPIHTPDGQLFGTLCGLDRHAGAASAPDLRAVLALFSGLLTRQLASSSGEVAAAESEASAPPPAAIEARDLTLLNRLTDFSREADKLQSIVTQLARLEIERSRWSRAVPFYCIEGDPQASWVEENPIIAHLASALADHDSDDTEHARPDQGEAGLILDANLISTQRLRVEAGLRARGTSVLVPASTPGGLRGGVLLLNDRLTPLREGEAWLLKHCAEHLSLIAERFENRQALDEATAQLEQSASRDSLTGLRNRRYLIEELGRILAQADRLGEMIHVAFINLDGFKAINDHYGHQAGDKLLMGVAERLQKTTRASDIVARYGGDEFVVVGPGINPGNSEHERQRLGERLKDAATGRYELGGLSLDYEGPSIGLITSEPGDMDPDRILALAEEEMYAVKEERRWNRRMGSSVIG